MKTLIPLQVRSLRKGGVINRINAIQTKIKNALVEAKTDQRKIDLTRRGQATAKALNLSNFHSSNGAIPLREFPVPSIDVINQYIDKLKAGK